MKKRFTYENGKNKVLDKKKKLFRSFDPRDEFLI